MPHRPRREIPFRRQLQRSGTALAWAGCWLLALGASLASAASGQEPGAKTMLVYEDHIAPLLEEHCTACHNPDSKEGGLDLTTADALMTGSKSGPIVTAGQSGRSLLYEMVHSGEMPLHSDPLPEADLERIAHWIDGGLSFREPPAAASQPLTQHDVLPIFLLRCTACHGAELQRGELDLRTIESLRRGGASGPAAIAGQPDASLLIERVEQELCPPLDQLLKYFVERPSDSEVEKLRTWIAQGMREEAALDDMARGLPDPYITEHDRQHWAFQPLPKQVAVPRVKEIEPASPIDAFVYQQLRDKGLEFSPAADRATLIRRVYLDLTGLPPSLEELDRWEGNQSGRWYEELVDHLLASPRYGERWGRYWLDVAGYADSEGGQSDDTVRQFAWKYRDYVIGAFNDDKPYDRFLLEQLAGDELADYTDPGSVTDEVVDNLVATGFLRMGVDETGSRTMNFVPERLGLISNALTVVSTGVMGLTMECARCHSHKYDPIPHTDYFRFKAIFQGAFDEHDWMSWKTRRLDVATPRMIAEREAVNGPLQAAIETLQAERKALVRQWQDRYYDEAWPKLSAEEQAQFKAALKVRATHRSMREKELVERYEAEVRPSEAVLAQRHEELREQLEQLDERIAATEEQLIPPHTIRALWDRGRPSPTYVLMRGEYNRPGRLVAPGVPSVLSDGKTPLEIEPPWPGAESTGRRLALARWLTGPDHPLTARVLVNRVWALHFGQGIVKTLDNFGTQGAEPTHPELLDWLARDFVDGGWSIKSLHRDMLLSRTYQQSSRRTLQSEQLDPENKLLSHFNLRRLDAEALRDSLLAVAGRLDTQMFGTPAPVSVRDDGLILDLATRSGGYRRSVYLQLRRTEMPTLLAAFDYPEMQPNCTERSTSTVSTQSLILKNNGRVYELAGSFAELILEQAGDDRSEMVRLAYRAAYGRSPSEEDATASSKALAELTSAWVDSGLAEEAASARALTTFCHALLNSAEFAYVD